MLEFLLEVVARFVGVFFITFLKWCKSGFSKSFRAEWEQIHDKYSGTHEWIDILGLVLIAICCTVIAVSVLTYTGQLC